MDGAGMSTAGRVRPPLMKQRSYPLLMERHRRVREDDLAWKQRRHSIGREHIWVWKEGRRWYEGRGDSNGCLQRGHLFLVHGHQIALILGPMLTLGMARLVPGLGPRLGRAGLAALRGRRRDWRVLASLFGATCTERRHRSIEGLSSEMLLLPVVGQEEKIKKVMRLLAVLDGGLEVAFANVGGPIDDLGVRQTGGLAESMDLILVRKWMGLSTP